MPNDNSKSPHKRFFMVPFYMAIITMLVVLVTIWVFEYSEKQRYELTIRTGVTNQLSAIRAKLEAGLNSRLFVMRGLVPNVSTTPNITQVQFAKLARVALEQQNGIHRLILAQNSVISHVYPSEENREFNDIVTEVLQSQQENVQQAIKSQHTLLLIIKDMFLSITPIFIPSSQHQPVTYWGLGITLISQNSLFREAGLANSISHKYALRDSFTGQFIFGKHLKRPVRLPVSLPNGGSWQLTAVPSNGWPTHAPISKWLWVIGIMLALMMGILVYTVLNEPAQLKQAVDRATDELQQAHQDIQSLEQQKYEQLAEYNRTLETKVSERTQELSHTLANLKAAQKELIHSEKMAALGQLVAGIAHEINTPLGTIRSSIENISDFLNKTLEQLPAFFQLLASKERQDSFALFIHEINQPQTCLSSREKRQLRKALVGQLKQREIENTTSVADTLVEMGIYDTIDNFLPLLESSDNSRILNTAYQLATLKNSTRRIIIASDRARRVVLALKKFAHYDHTGKKERADIIEGIETVLMLYYNQIKHGVELIKDYSPLPLVMCYFDELAQVWTNLIQNALHAMNSQGKLKIEVAEIDHHAVISFTDNGAGIPDEFKHKIFEPFFTTKPTGEGSGLGLDIVKKIIDQHDGTITMTSVPGQTTFTVSLPI